MSGETPGAAPGPRRTPLHAAHVAAGGHMVPFAGWEMPLYYAPSGILAEHRAVREGVGVFDVSHMTILTVEGEPGAELLQRRTPARIAASAPGQCRYTFFLNAKAQILDDLLVTRLDGAERPRAFLVVPNAGPGPRVFEVLLQQRPQGAEVRRWNGDAAILAVQGPRSRSLLESTFGWDLSSLKFYTGGYFPEGHRGPPTRHAGIGPRWPPVPFVSRTGYTGELGYEVVVPASLAPACWERIVAAGALPCGLGARDTLRLEKGYVLSGVDFHADRTPAEAGMDRFLDLDHPFVGRDELKAQIQAGTYARWSGIAPVDPQVIPRHGTPVLHGGTVVATVTSGGRSPTLGTGIALAYLPPALARPGTEVELEVRGQRFAARVGALPFVPAARRPGG